MIQKADNYYHIGGVSVNDIVAQFGTPVYVYDADNILRQYNSFKSAFPDTQLKIKYACKSLNNINILKLLNNAGSGLDTVSIYEVQMGLHAGFKPSDILFTPNCVDFDEIKAGVEAGVQINIDNISILEQFGHTYGNTVPVCIRLNPHVLAGGNQNISTGHIDSKFGISIHQMRHVLRIVKSTDLLVNGLHIHTGSDILDAEVFLQTADILFDYASQFEHLKFLDFGSGFKVPYKPGDYATDIQDLGKKLEPRFKEFCTQYGRELELWFEPGKYLVSMAGTLLVKVNVIKQTTAAVFAGVNSGMNHLIRPMLYDAYHLITNVSNLDGPERLYTVVGNICETDTFGWDRRLTEVHEGDILALSNAGAYGFTMSNNYNARPKPAEVLVFENKAYLIRERETWQDQLRGQIAL